MNSLYKMDAYDEELEEMLLLMMLLPRRRYQGKKKISRKTWVRKIYKKRERKSAFHTLVQELRTVDRVEHFRLVKRIYITRTFLIAFSIITINVTFIYLKLNEKEQDS